MGFGDVAGPDGGGEAVGGGVGAGGDLVDRLELEDGHDGAKDFVGGDGHFVFDIDEERGLDVEATVAVAFAAGEALGAFFVAEVDVVHDLVVLSFIDLRALLGGGIERVAELAAFVH